MRTAQSVKTSISLSVSSGFKSLYMIMDDQVDSLAPESELNHWIKYYWHLGFPDTKIADHAMDHFDRKIYGLRLV